jgi:hypothetical protein
LIEGILKYAYRKEGSVVMLCAVVLILGRASFKWELYKLFNEEIKM